MRWLWTSKRVDARLARLALLPAAGLWRVSTMARRTAYARGWLPHSELSLPTIALGNITIGDSGKTPLLGWVTRHLAATGARPGVVLRQGSPWRVAAVQHAVGAVPVTGSSEPARGVARVEAAGAHVAVIEADLPPGDCRPDLTIAVVGAETERAVRWPVPAGPWRESWAALRSAGAIVVTRKRATPDAAAALVRELQPFAGGPIAVVHLGVRHLEGLVSGAEHPATALAGRRVVAATGSADPGAFISQVKATGAAVQVARWDAPDELRDEDVAWLAHAARRADFVVVAQSDAVKLRDRWPARVAEPLVAVLDLTWESNGEAILAALDQVAMSVAGG